MSKISWKKVQWQWPAAVLFIVIMFFVGYSFGNKNQKEAEPVVTNDTKVIESVPSDLIDRVTFVCLQDKSILADFYPAKVTLTLHDGRTMTLPQKRTASGARYASDDENFVFWNKGNSAYVVENKSTVTFNGCYAKK